MTRVEKIKFLFLIFLVSWLTSFSQDYKVQTFGTDLDFLRQKTDLIVLKNGKGQIIVSPEYQGRVLTVTTNGLEGLSLGWFNKKKMSTDSVQFNKSGLGGASRLWFGPDQGPFTLFFKVDPQTGKKEHGAPNDLDTLSFKIFDRTEKTVSLRQKLHLKNYANTDFYIDVKRDITLLNKNEITNNLNLKTLADVNWVAFKAETSMQNIGSENWSKEQGLISIWELGCMRPSPKTTAIIPLRGKPKSATVYFTAIDSSRIAIKNNVLFYKADANYLNKIGTLPEHSLSYFGSYSPELNLLTIIKYSFNKGDRDFVNSHPINIEDQFKGDVINIFNDGKLGDIGPFGPFYELETSSSAKALKVNETISHTHETYYFEGSKKALNIIAENVLGVTLKTIETALPH